jgi:hypothetical protein
MGATKTGGISSSTGGSATGGVLSGTGGVGSGGVLSGTGGSATVGGSNSGGLVGTGGVALGGSGTGGVGTGGTLAKTGGLGAGGTTINPPPTNTGGDSGSGLNGDAILSAANFKHYVDRFNTMENEPIVKAVPNAKAWEWMTKNIPLFECSNATIEKIYYYRWWTYRKHIIQEPTGRTLSEFITWEHANSSAYGHHLAEGRWLHDSSLLDEYTHYWYRHGFEEKLHRYSQWSMEALYRRYLVTLDKAFLIDLLDDLIKDYQRWENERKLSSGLFWQYDVRDAMEESISGSREAKNVRPTINSYMAANAWALSQIATLAGRSDVALKYQSTYKLLREKMIQAMWDAGAKFFKVQFENGTLSDAREAIGFIPWKFNLPGPEHVDAWLQIRDPQGFLAPRGLTTAERRHPKFRSHGVGTCEWDGAVWPFATSQTLDGLANVLRSEGAKPVDKSDYFNALVTYADSHQKNGLPYIGEYLDEVTGEWLKGDAERSRWYNHSTYCDLVISGLVGIVPRADTTVEVHPLVPAESLDWFALDYVRYHGYRLTVLWDKDGSRYRRGVGLKVYIDGQLIAQSSTLSPVTGNLPGKASP